MEKWAQVWVPRKDSSKTYATATTAAAKGFASGVSDVRTGCRRGVLGVWTCHTVCRHPVTRHGKAENCHLSPAAHAVEMASALLVTSKSYVRFSAKEVWEIVFFSFLTSLLEYKCFTLVCQFLLYNKVNQLYIYMYPHIPSLLRLPPILPIPALQVVTKHRADLPVLCGCFPLAIHFTFGSVWKLVFNSSVCRVGRHSKDGGRGRCGCCVQTHFTHYYVLPPQNNFSFSHK